MCSVEPSVGYCFSAVYLTGKNHTCSGGSTHPDNKTSSLVHKECDTHLFDILEGFLLMSLSTGRTFNTWVVCWEVELCVALSVWTVAAENTVWFSTCRLRRRWRSHFICTCTKDIIYYIAKTTITASLLQLAFILHNTLRYTNGW